MQNNVDGLVTGQINGTEEQARKLDIAAEGAPEPGKRGTTGEAP
jgi:hypothetical protein